MQYIPDTEHRTPKKRIDYIDFLKGLTILGVIFVHSGGHPSWFTPNHVNTIFFFLAGIFFKPRPFKQLVKKNFYSLIIPFLFFFLLSYPVNLIFEYWDHRELSALSWDAIFDLFEIHTRADYLSVNVPLWFILCIFVVQMIYWCISHFPQWGQWASMAVIFMVSGYINENVPTPFMINNAVYFTLYFGIGNLLGLYLIKWFGNKSLRIIIIALSLILVLASYWCLSIPELQKSKMVESIHFLGYSICCMGLCSFLNGIKRLEWLRFFGINTLVILGVHILFLIPINRCLYMLMNHQESIILAILDTTLCALIMIPVIIFINQAIPIATGKYPNRHSNF